MTEHPDLTVKEVAALLRLNVGTVKKLCRDGDLPGAYKTTASPQGNWRIPHAAITAYRTARQPNPEPKQAPATGGRSLASIEAHKKGQP
jgi:excisionase family DNA binding protein